MKYKIHLFVLILCPIIIIFLFYKNIEGASSDPTKNDFTGVIGEYYGPFTGFDYGGNDIKSYKNTSETKCLQYCSNNSECIGIIRSSSDDCWLKSAFGEKSPNSDRLVYYKYDYIPYDFSEGSDYNGNDIAFYKSDEEVCMKICNNTYECAGVVANSNRKECWLKKSLNNPTPNSQRKAYKKKLIESAYTVMDGYDYNGNDIAHETNMTTDKCIKTCNWNSGCAGVVMHTNGTECWLKSTMTTSTDNNQRKAYLKKK